MSLAGGIVILFGIDAEDGGPGGHGEIQGWQAVMEKIMALPGNDQDSALILGGTLDPGYPQNDVHAFWDAALEGFPRSYAAGSELSSVDFSPHRMVVVTSNYPETPAGGLRESENLILGTRATDFRNYVLGGGRLLGFTQARMNFPYQYLSEIAVITGGEYDYFDISKTDEGARINIVDDLLDAGYWHEVYTSFPPELRVLATVNEGSGNVIEVNGEFVTVFGLPAIIGNIDLVQELIAFIGSASVFG